MDSSPDSQKPFAAVWVVVALGAAFRLFLALGPETRLIGSVADDAFYYTEIARNFDAGVGPTMGGDIFTNGWHPLWMLLAVALQRLVGPDPIRVARGLLVFSTLLSFASCALIVTWIRRYVAPASRYAPLAAMLFWVVNPYVIGGETMGVEAPLALVAGLWTLLVHEQVRRAPTIRGWAAVGAMLGVTFLARTDWGLLAPVVFFSALNVERRDAAPGRALRLARTLAMPAAALAVAAPWFAWNLARFGTIWQDSGRALMTRTHVLDAIRNRDAWDVVRDRLPLLIETLARLTGAPRPWIGLLTVAALVVVVAWTRPRGVESPYRWPWTLTIFSGISVTVYFFVLQEYKVYYFLAVCAVYAFALARVCAVVEARWTGASARRAVWASLLLAGLMWAQRAESIYLERGGFVPWQNDYRRAATDIAAGRIPGIGGGEVYASFNSGILTAFSGRPFVNLDGVVNPEIPDAVRRRKLATYLRAKGVTIVVDDTVILTTSLLFSHDEPPPRFADLAVYPMTGGEGEYRVLRLLPSE